MNQVQIMPILREKKKFLRERQAVLQDQAREPGSCSVVTGEAWGGSLGEVKGRL